MEGLSPGPVEGWYLVIFSFFQVPLALLKFYEGLLCSFEANITLFRLPDVGNWIPDTGQDVLLMVRSEMRRNLQRGWKPEAFTSDKGLTQVFHTWKDARFQRGSARGAKGRHPGKLVNRGILFEVEFLRTWWGWGVCVALGWGAGMEKCKCMLFNHRNSC